MKTDDNLMGPEIMLFLSNQTGQNITVQANDFSINGYMITPLLSCDIIDGKVAYSTIYLDTEELKRNGIDRIDTIECKFVVLNPSTWDTIFESDPVSIRIERQNPVNVSTTQKGANDCAFFCSIFRVDPVIPC